MKKACYILNAIQCLIGAGFVCSQTLPILYEKYEDQIDGFLYNLLGQFQNHYSKLDVSVLSKLSKGNLRSKKNDQSPSFFGSSCLLLCDRHAVLLSNKDENLRHYCEHNSSNSVHSLFATECWFLISQLVVKQLCKQSMMFFRSIPMHSKCFFEHSLLMLNLNDQSLEVFGF